MLDAHDAKALCVPALTTIVIECVVCVTGHYMYIEASSPRKAGEKARLHSEILPAGPAMCLSFWYHMHGTGMGTLTVYKQPAQDNGLMDSMWEVSGEQGNLWKQAFVNIGSSVSQYTIVFEGVVGNSYLSDIAIDDILYQRGGCPANSTTPTFRCRNRQRTITSDKVCDFVNDCTDGSDEARCGNCTFQQDTCNYRDVSSGSFRFIRTSNATSDGSMQLPADHTYNRTSGFLLYVDSSQGGANSLATLQSPVLRKTAAGCMVSFYYYVLGRGGGTVQVSVKTGAGRVTPIWSSGTSQYSGRWIHAVANVGAFDGDFRLLLQGKRFFSYGSIVVDDVTLLDCSYPPAQPRCPANTFRCPRGFCIPQYQVCDLDQNCGPGAGNDESNCTAAHLCDFERSTCDWRQDRTDNFDWTRKSGLTPTPNTGPTRDHTSGLTSGHYMYTESSAPRRAGQKARLLSPVIQAATASDGCYIHMYYNMFGTSMGTLNVYLRTATNGYVSKLLGRSGNLGQVWVQFSQQLVSSQPFQVVIEGVIGRGYRSDLAIDDLVLSSGCRYTGTTLPTAGYITTTASTTPNTCGASKFQCADGSCIDLIRYCDFTKDCHDGSDEAMCGACNFENGLCGYRDMSVGRYNWTLSYGAVMGAVGPAVDHTIRTRGGHYAYVEGTRGVFRQVARLRSPVLPTFSGSCIMTFFYFLGGPQVGSLEVGVVGNGTYRRLFLAPRYTTSAIMWRPGYVYLGRYMALIPAGSRLEFRVQPGLGRLANNSDDIAIDDISFRNCDPKQYPPNVSCTFEHGLCIWTQAQNDRFDWLLSNHTTPSRGTGPQFDHTLPGRGGVFAYIESSGKSRGDVAALQTPWLSPTDSTGYCLSFWYHMFGSTIGNLTLSMLTPSSRQVFWSTHGPHGDAWRQVQRTIQSSEQYSLVFQASVGGYLGDIAIDDITGRKGRCPPKTGCDFEEGLCGWSFGQTDKLNWTLGSNGVAGRGTGPRLDHTFGSNTGHYIYLGPGQPGDKAALLSPPSIVTANTFVYGCLRLWYYMAGPSTGSLNVSLHTNGSSILRPLWGIQGDQGSFWKHASIQLPYIRSHGFTVVIEATRGNSNQGNIAIDDLLYTRTRCPPAGSCNFEADMCSYMNVNGDNFDWQRDNGGTSTATTGPTTDHTRRTAAGYYMYIESSGVHHPGDKAWLVSETIPAPRSPAGGCVSFWYHMYGAGIGTLNVYTRTASSQNRTLIWTVSGNQGNVWRSGRAPASVTESYQVIFEGVYGGNNTGDIAIDDITVVGTHCYGITTTTVAPTTVTSPASYPPTSVDCDFESATCNWQQDGQDQFDWTVQSGQTPSTGTGPTADHTYGTRQGHYAYTEVSGKTTNSSARLISPAYTVGSVGVCFKFWYYMYGSSVNTLNLWTKLGGNSPSLVSGVVQIERVLVFKVQLVAW